MFDQLASLLAGYFHQDWDLEFDGFVEVATHFATEAEIDHIALVVGQLLLVAEGDDEAAIEAFLAESGSYYRPAEGTLKQWVREFAEAIASASQGRITPV